MDSFFGFDTSLLAASNVEGNDAGGGKRSPASRYFREDESDEEEYDALNDETFGSADNKGDWEHIHENLVRLESGVKEDDAASSELEDCHSRALQLEDYDLDLKFNYYDTNDESGRSSVGAQSIGDEFASKLRLDPSIWGSPDYYFTMYKERLAALEGDSHASRTYKDNQLNHPFTQPKGHAQLLLMSSMAKNAGMLNVAGRERKCSESKAGGGPASEAKDGGCTYAPLQFENSLGKLQCGSVTAPRKIIDMDVMGGDERDVNGNGINLEHTVSQRKTRQVLLLIETLYKMVLKLEDLLNPTAIEAITLLREKRERDRQCLANGGVDSFRGSVASLPEHTESFDELIAALIGSLSQDKTTSILSVRKGKILLRRILAVLRNHPFRWTLWAMIFNAIPWLPRKDRDDADGLLFSLYAEFERHVQGGTVADLLRVSKTFDPSAGDGTAAMMQCVATCKLLLSVIITIIFQMEVLYSKNPRTLIEEQDESSWVAFLQHANRIVVGKGTTTKANGSAAIQSSIRISPDNNIARTVRLHFERFGDRVDGADLMHFITDNGNSGTKSRADGN
uniref:Uncharacterized protein n=1 Tax=Anopheles atroparvus TaxID=41427 RepID=A0A182IJ75_ANOAO